MRRPSIACSPARNTANGGAGTGWTSGAYSDWDGFAAEIRESRPFIWHWRDWIVESLNRNLGYDRMIVLMLAADEAAPDDDSSLRATGFLARNWDKFSRVRWLDNDVEHTAKAFLGLTIVCARCHDHKYDPIAQTDYYRFRAFFEPHEVREDRLPLGPDAARDGLPRAFDAKLNEPTYLFARGDDGRPDKSKVIPPGVPDFLTRAPVQPAPVRIPAKSRFPMLRDVVKDDLRANALKAVEAARQAAHQIHARRSTDCRGGTARCGGRSTSPLGPNPGGRSPAHRPPRTRGQDTRPPGQACRSGTRRS